MSAVLFPIMSYSYVVVCPASLVSVRTFPYLSYVYDFVPPIAFVLVNVLNKASCV